MISLIKTYLNMRGKNMLDEHHVVTLFYDPTINRFIDEFGSVINNIFKLITPGQLMVFKDLCHGDYPYIIPDVTNSFLVELIYPDDDYFGG